MTITNPDDPRLAEAKFAYTQAIESFRALQAAKNAHRDAEKAPEPFGIRIIATRKKVEDLEVIDQEFLKELEAAQNRTGDVDWDAVFEAWAAPYNNR